MRNGTKLVIAGIGVAAVLGGGSALAVAANSAPASVSGSTAASFSRVSPETQVDLGTLADATPAPSAGGTAQRVSREQAIQIAQRRVPGARVTEVEREVEHGRATWKVELRDGRTEFEVHVAIDNGEIIEFEQDFDD